MRIIFLFLLCFAVGCGINSDKDDLYQLEGSWDKINIEEERVELTDSSGDTFLYTSGDKLFQLSFESSNIYNGKLLFEAEDAYIADFVNMQNSHLILGLRHVDLQTEGPIFYESLDNGSNWQTIDISYPDKMEHFIIGYLEKGGQSTEHLIAYAGRILDSNDGGKSWSILFEEGNFSSFLYTDEKHPEQIWTGGDTAIHQPYLAKSSDGGNSWMNLNNNIGFHVDAVVRDIILHHQQSDWVLAGLGGPESSSNVVRKSTDAGENWETVLEETGVHVFARSLLNPDLIYASGRDASGKLFFAWTADFGDTWEKQVFEKGPDLVTIKDMEVMNIEGQETLFFGTDQGLFNFTVE